MQQDPRVTLSEQAAAKAARDFDALRNNPQTKRLERISEQEASKAAREFDALRNSPQAKRLEQAALMDADANRKSVDEQIREARDNKIMTTTAFDDDQFAKIFAQQAIQVVHSLLLTALGAEPARGALGRMLFSKICDEIRRTDIELVDLLAHTQEGAAIVALMAERLAGDALSNASDLGTPVQRRDRLCD